MSLDARERLSAQQELELSRTDLLAPEGRRKQSFSEVTSSNFNKLYGGYGTKVFSVPAARFVYDMLPFSWWLLVCVVSFSVRLLVCVCKIFEKIFFGRTTNKRTGRVE